MGVASVTLIASAIWRCDACTPWPVKADEHLPQRGQSTAVGQGLSKARLRRAWPEPMGTKEAAPVACSAGYESASITIG